MVQKIYSKMHLLSLANTPHDVSNLGGHECLKKMNKNEYKKMNISSTEHEFSMKSSNS